MKKTLFILLVIASLTACGGKKEEVRKTPSKEGTMAADTLKDSSPIENIHMGEVEEGAFQSAHEKTLEGVCVIDEVRDLGDPELDQLYGDLGILQEKADEWAKFPRDLDELEEITTEIGRLKGRIAYRSLRIYSSLN